MVWHAKKHLFIERIAKTGFMVSVISYLTFWGADLIQPGFVSRYFSVHIFLLSAVVFGLLWGRFIEEYTDRHLIQTAIAGAFGLLLAVLTWHASEDLGSYRVLIALIGFCTPVLVFRLLKH
jgi:hypothetical protein